MFNAFRNLYKVWDTDHQVVAVVTAQGEVDALTKYRDKGGEVDQVVLERVSTGYPVDVVEVYA